MFFSDHHTRFQSCFIKICQIFANQPLKIASGKKIEIAIWYLYENLQKWDLWCICSICPNLPHLECHKQLNSFKNRINFGFCQNCRLIAVLHSRLFMGRGLAQVENLHTPKEWKLMTKKKLLFIKLVLEGIKVIH